MSSHDIVIIDVPTEAGTHWAGQAKAPQALREAGLSEKLQKLGFQVSSIQALDQPQTWVPADIINGVRNEENVVEVCNKVSKAVSSERASQKLQLILGGDCSIELGVLSGLNALYPEKRIGVLYFDGDADLSIPTDDKTGILDSMVISRLLRREGGLKSMKQFGKLDGSPLVDKDSIVLFGFDPDEPKTSHWCYLAEGGYKVFCRPTVSSNPCGKAAEALSWLEDRVDKILIHFDLDVIDSAKYPIGNFPHYGGLNYDEAMTVLKVFLSSRKLVGLVITEINPNNDTSTGQMVENLVKDVSQCFAMRLENQN